MFPPKITTLPKNLYTGALVASRRVGRRAGRCAAVVAVLALAVHSAVADTVTSENPTPSQPVSENGWEVTLGAGVFARSGFFYVGDEEEYDEYGPAVLADITYQHNDFFAVLSQRDIALGYRLWDSAEWSLDAVLSPKQAGFSSENSALANQDEQDIDLHFGARFTRYFDTSRFSFELSNDIAGVHDSYIASATYLKEWQYRNWLISSQLSASYLSQDVTQYYYGVDTHEASNRFPAFRANGSVLFGADLRVDYPLTEHWVFRASAHALQVTGDIKSSPLIDDSTIVEMTIGVNYVF